MANCGNFLEYAGSRCGLDVGYGKMFVLYAEKVSKSAADLTAEAIQAEIVAGTVIGIIKGWNTIAGAPVAEINVERTGTAEMKLIRSEIAADTLTFENSIANNEILNDVVKAGSLNCILIDDQGNCFGDYSQTSGKISSMLVNFSGKTTSSFQKDNVTEKSVSVTARYLVKDVNVIQAGTETELIVSKTLLIGQLSSITTLTSSAAVFVMKINDKAIGAIYGEAIATGELTVTGAAITSKTASYVPSTGLLTVTLAGTFDPGLQPLNVSLSGDAFYMKENTIRLGE